MTKIRRRYVSSHIACVTYTTALLPPCVLQGYPSGDGNCAAPACDVGSVPVGEYLFNHMAANVSVNGQTFLRWFIDECRFRTLVLSIGHAIHC